MNGIDVHVDFDPGEWEEVDAEGGETREEEELARSPPSSHVLSRSSSGKWTASSSLSTQITRIFTSDWKRRVEELPPILDPPPEYGWKERAVGD